MRRFIYIILVVFVLLASFWIYLWSYRKEFIENTLERSYPAKFTIEKVSFPSLGDLVITNIKIIPKDTDNNKSPIVINEVVITASIDKWLFWLLIPSKKPLQAETVTVVLPESSTPQLLPTTSPLRLSVSELVILKKGKTEKMRNLSECTDVLNTVLQYNPTPSPQK